MMGCLSDNTLAALLEGQLSIGEAAEAHRHLDGCAGCRSLVVDTLGASPRAPPRSTPPVSLSMAETLALPSSQPEPHREEEGRPEIDGYRIRERLGRGAMGEVYLADDLQLERRVAIKFLSARGEPAARGRFLMEARAVARLRHPNIVTIYSSDIAGERPYLVSELLTGQSLDRVQLPLPADEVERIALALGRGLAAAHRQGVLHRDIKPANVMLTADGEIKLLDFGLAKLIDGAAEPARPEEGESGRAPASNARTLTRTGALVGTPLYMAPEIWHGSPATPASDVYSLGALLYELSTGRPPHDAATLEALRREAEAGPIELLARLAPALDPGVAAIVTRCLSRDPSSRFASGIELSRVLEAGAASRPRWARWRLSPLLGAVGAAAGAAIVAAGLFFAPSKHLAPAPAGASVSVSVSGEPALASPRGARRAIAVLSFANVARRNEVSWLSTALSEMLSTELAVGETLRLVPGEDVARMAVDLELPGQPTFGQDTLHRIQRYAAIDVLVLGSFVPTGTGDLRVDVRLQDAGTGETLAAVAEVGKETGLHDLVSRLGERLRAALGVLALSSAQAVQARVATPSSPVATRLYAEGLERFRAFDYEAARERLERAAAEEPHRPMTHHLLSELWAALGQQEKERREAELAFAEREGLPRESRIRIEARHYQSHQEKSLALESLRVLHELFPDNLDHGLDLAHVQPREEALATLAQLRLLPPPTGDDPRIDLAEYDVGAVTSDRRKAVERATAKGRARGARLIVGLARGLEGWGAWDQGNIAEAQAAWDESLGILEVRGQFVGVTGALRGRAGIALLRDDIDRALELYSSAEARLRAVGNHSSLIYALNNVAHVRTLKGDLPAARAGLDESLALAERVGNKMKVAQSSHALGRLEHQLGDMTAAGRAYDRALALCDELSDPWLCRGFLGSIGQYHAARDDFARARDEFQRIIAGKDAEGRARTAAPDRRDFAALALEEGKLDEAMDWIDQALAEFEREEAPIERALAEGVQARIWAAKGDMGRARAVVDAADARSARSKNKLARIQVRIAWARIHALDPDPAARRSAMRALAEARADSARYGFYPQLLEARFGEGEAEAASGDRPRARACFTAVERDARARGFTLLARRAAERRAALR